MRHIVMLRGINLGSSNRIAMPELRAALETAGFRDVRTYVQSGNVLLTSTSSPEDVATRANALIKDHTVIVPDLRGMGLSSYPNAGYDKKTLAADIHALTTSLGFDRVRIAGHDIGLMVAYAYAAQFPQATERLLLMDAFLPGIGNWKDVWLLRDLWHFHFYGEVPLALVQGRERIYLEHFWNDFAADRTHSVPEADRRIYAEAYAQPGGMRAGFEYFRSFEQDARDFAQLGATRLAMPLLVLTGEKASGTFLIEQAKLVASNIRGEVIKGSGHWLMEEAPAAVIPAITDFVR